MRSQVGVLEMAIGILALVAVPQIPVFVSAHHISIPLILAGLASGSLTGALVMRFHARRIEELSAAVGRVIEEDLVMFGLKAAGYIGWLYLIAASVTLLIAVMLLESSRGAWNGWESVSLLFVNNVAMVLSLGTITLGGLGIAIYKLYEQFSLINSFPRLLGHMTKQLRDAVEARPKQDALVMGYYPLFGAASLSDNDSYKGFCSALEDASKEGVVEMYCLKPSILLRQFDGYLKMYNESESSRKSARDAFLQKLKCLRPIRSRYFFVSEDIPDYHIVCTPSRLTVFFPLRTTGTEEHRSAGSEARVLGYTTTEGELIRCFREAVRERIVRDVKRVLREFGEQRKSQAEQFLQSGWFERIESVESLNGVIDTFESVLKGNPGTEEFYKSYVGVRKELTVLLQKDVNWNEKEAFDFVVELGLGEMKASPEGEGTGSDGE